MTKGRRDERTKNGGRERGRKGEEDSLNRQKEGGGGRRELEHLPRVVERRV